MKKFAVLFAFACLVFPSSAFGQATRTWVSGVGDDANPCSRTAPCKTWAGAISKTFIGGEIDALDSGAFGVLTITKSVTVNGGSSFAGTLASGSAAGITVNVGGANANDPLQKVVLRNLSINGTGASSTVGTNTGLNGVRIDAAKAVHIENVRIANFVQNGIDFTPTATGDASLMLDGVTVSENGGNGLVVGAAAAAQKLNVLVRDSTITGSRGTLGTAGDTGIGVSAGTGASVWLTGTTIFDNLIGLKTSNAAGGSAGAIHSYCDNAVGGNADDGVAPNLLCPLPPVQTNTVTNNVITTAPAPASAPVVLAAAPECVVPNLKGLTTAFAKRLLAVANCGLGTVTKKRTTKAKQVGKVTGQKTPAGKRLAKGTKIAVTVGRR
jgi:hypothetical protein